MLQCLSVTLDPELIRAAAREKCIIGRVLHDKVPQKQSFCGRHTSDARFIRELQIYKRHACARIRATTQSRPYEIRGNRKNVFPFGTFAHRMKRHVSGRPHGVRTRPLSLILADAKSSLLGRFFLLPTKALLLWEPYGSAFRNPRRVGTWSFCSLFLTEKLHIFDQCLLLPTKAELLREPYEVRKWLSQNANAVRFVGKRRRRRPKRRFFAGKPSNCAGRRRWVKAQPCRLNRATTWRQNTPYLARFS